MMKSQRLKSATIALFLICLSVLGALTVAAEGGTEGLLYALNDEGTAYTVTGYEGESTEVVIPDKHQGLPVTRIGDEAFMLCNYITKISIPDTVLYIGVDAFLGCIRLQYNNYGQGRYLGNEENPYHALINGASVNISTCEIHEQAVMIADQAFAEYSSLESVFLSDSITHIGQGAFLFCEILSGISWGENSQLTYIGDAAFRSCNALTEITIPSSVREIGFYAFSYCENLERVTVEDGVTVIGESMFRECDKLGSVVLPDSVTTIGQSAFYNCDALTSVVIGEGVTSIGSYAFRGCSALTDTVIPASVKSVGKYAFYGCRAMDVLTVLSRDVEIYDHEGTIAEEITLCGYAGSTAQAYAEAHERTFLLIEEENAVAYGDANGDGAVNGQDLLLLRKYLANYDYATGSSTIETTPGADANGDATVNGQDLLLLRKYLANLDYATGESTVLLGPSRGQ